MVFNIGIRDLELVIMVIIFMNELELTSYADVSLFPFPLSIKPEKCYSITVIKNITVIFTKCILPKTTK